MTDNFVALWTMSEEDVDNFDHSTIPKDFWKSLSGDDVVVITEALDEQGAATSDIEDMAQAISDAVEADNECYIITALRQNENSEYSEDFRNRCIAFAKCCGWNDGDPDDPDHEDTAEVEVLVDEDLAEIIDKVEKKPEVKERPKVKNKVEKEKPPPPVKKVVAAIIPPTTTEKKPAYKIDIDHITRIMQDPRYWQGREMLDRVFDADELDLVALQRKMEYLRKPGPRSRYGDEIATHLISYAQSRLMFTKTGSPSVNELERRFGQI